MTNSAHSVPEAHRRTPSGKLRARGAGIPFDGVPGVYNAITDVAGVEVGYRTLIRGSGPLVVGRGPVRTGVTAILPRGRERASSAVWAGVASLNGNGEMTAYAWIEEAGRCEGPISITNTHSCGVARDATIEWVSRQRSEQHHNDAIFWLPVAAETYDGGLNDVDGHHVKREHVFEAFANARSGRLDEGSVGGGTGMRCFGFKAGSGTASRRIDLAGAKYHVGVFVQANFGSRSQCTVAGVPVGAHLPTAAAPDSGSIIVVVATDAPLLPHQLKRVARRPSLGIARTGGIGSHYSGDLFLAFTTANAAAVREAERVVSVDYLPDQMISPLFEATVQATEEAIVNSFVGTEAMTGRDDLTVEAFPVAAAQAILSRHGRLLDV
jgi:L-aminopeptidase/D-esterase-like protein